MVEATFRLPLAGANCKAVVSISMDSIVVANKDLLCCELADDAVMLDFVSGVYYGLDPVATYIWGLIREPKVVSDVRDALLEEYDVEPERCERDLLTLFGEMSARKLIEVTNETAS